MAIPFLSGSPVASAEIKSVCVFCGSGDGADPLYIEQAYELGKVLGTNNIRLVYGGGSVGLMGAVARGTTENGGDVLAITPEPLYKPGPQMCKAEIVPDMPTRKKRMADESDAFVCLPGGYGTMEEMLEVISWSQLNIHSKPILLLNTKGFYNLFLEWIELCVHEKYIPIGHLDIFVTCDTAKAILNLLENYKAPSTRYNLDWAKKERPSKL